MSDSSLNEHMQYKYNNNTSHNRQQQPSEQQQHHRNSSTTERLVSHFTSKIAALHNNDSLVVDTEPLNIDDSDDYSVQKLLLNFQNELDLLTKSLDDQTYHALIERAKQTPRTPDIDIFRRKAAPSSEDVQPPPPSLHKSQAFTSPSPSRLSKSGDNNSFPQYRDNNMSSHHHTPAPMSRTPPRPHGSQSSSPPMPIETPAYDWPHQGGRQASTQSLDGVSSTWKATWESMRELMERQESKLQQLQQDNQDLMDSNQVLKDENAAYKEKQIKMQDEIAALRLQCKEMRLLEQDHKDLKAYMMQAQQENSSMHEKIDKLEKQMEGMERETLDLSRALRTEKDKHSAYVAQQQASMRSSNDRAQPSYEYRQPSEFYDPRDQQQYYSSNNIQHQQQHHTPYQARTPYQQSNTRDVATEPRLPTQQKVDFSPGTKFVAELSKVMELETGHHAPLSEILDRQLQRELDQQRRGAREWSR